MTGFEIGQYAYTLLGAVLIVRLISLGLFWSYRAFSIFLIFDLFQSFAFIFVSSKLNLQLDYRLVWSASRAISWVLTLWAVYSLLSAVLKSLPGILKFSRLLLNLVFIASLALSLFTIGPEYRMLRAPEFADGVKRIALLTLVVERAVTMSAFMALLAILIFILWFPVEIPRNLVMFSVGLVIYLGAKTALLLVHTYGPKITSQALDTIGIINTSVLALCFVCWSTAISRAGQNARVRIGHSWQAQEQERLVIQLEAMNTALLRSR